MMKTILFIIVFFLSSSSVLSQTTDVVTGLLGATGIAFHGDELYISEYGANKISKINVTDSSPTIQDVVTAIRPLQLAVNGNELFIAERYPKKVTKVDLSAITPVKVDVLQSSYGIDGIAFNGNDLFVAHFYDHRISKYDMTNTANPIESNILPSSSYFPLFLAKKDNFMFFTVRGVNKIYKIDINNPVFSIIEVVDILGPYGLAFHGNDLYIAEQAASRVVKIDVTQNSPNKEVIVSGLYGVSGLAFKGSELYIAQEGSATNSKISKLDLNTLNTNNFSFKSIELFPNPVKDLFTVSLQNNATYTLLSVNGKVLKQGNFNIGDNSLNISNLPNGMYFLQVESTHGISTKKIIKQ